MIYFIFRRFWKITIPKKKHPFLKDSQCVIMELTILLIAGFTMLLI